MSGGGGGKVGLGLGWTGLGLGLEGLDYTTGRDSHGFQEQIG